MEKYWALKACHWHPEIRFYQIWKHFYFEVCEKARIDKQVCLNGGGSAQAEDDVQSSAIYSSRLESNPNRLPLALNLYYH